MNGTTMPEAPIHENCDPLSRKYDVGNAASRVSRPAVNPVSKAHAMENPPEDKFWSGVRLSVRLHGPPHRR
jgi:hypothetical protein